MLPCDKKGIFNLFLINYKKKYFRKQIESMKMKCDQQLLNDRNFIFAININFAVCYIWFSL